MVKAMVIGRRDEITSEMEYVYNATGTSHILAVSGLHVGIVFLIFSRLFKFMNYGKLRWFYLTLIVMMIWSYALITGLSPSVMRASTMISIVLLADASWRKSNIYNSILVSAFLLLLLDSNLIYSVSFQLSYVAVFGIVFLYNRIYRLLFIKNRLLNFFWKITVLSISAQMATFPLTIYYFHQFPLFSLITNLLAIPTAGLVVIGSLCLIVTSFIEPVPNLIGKLMEICISIYNEVMLFISSLEYTLIEDVHLKPYAVFLIFFSLLLIARFIVNYKLSNLKYLIIILFVLVASKFLDYGIRSSQSKIIFYDVPGKSYYDVYLGRKCYTNVKEGSDELFYNVIPSRDFNLISEVNEIGECPFSKIIGDNLLIYFNGTSILLLADIDDLSKQSEDIIFNYVFINKSSRNFAPIILQKFKIDHIIFDASIRHATIEKISKDIDLKINTYSIAEQGALEIHFKTIDG